MSLYGIYFVRSLIVDECRGRTFTGATGERAWLAPCLEAVPPSFDTSQATEKCPRVTTDTTDTDEG